MSKSATFYDIASVGIREDAETLLTQGFDINERGACGETPLMRTLRSRNTDIADFLLEHGADIHTQDNDGWTALMSAVWSSYYTNILVEKGANCTLKEKNGRTALDIAKEKQDSYSTLEAKATMERVITTLKNAINAKNRAIFNAISTLKTVPETTRVSFSKKNKGSKP